MKTIDVDVIVIGGGATGAGVVRDVAMRGYSAALVDRADLAQGTTGRYHGLLHSGGRYVVSDPQSATECAQENAILTRIHSDAVEATGGYFVTGPDDDPSYGDQFLAGARAAGVPAEEIPVAACLAAEPRVNSRIQRAIGVLDGAVDGWTMVWGAARSAQEYGAHILTYHEVTNIITDDGRVTAVECHDRKSGDDVRLACRFVLNCAGAWAGEVAAMAGCPDVEVVPGRGIMIAMNHRLVNSVVNRLIYPADGDILVPVHTVSIIGTTDVKAADPDQLRIPRDEVQQMFDAGEVLVPGFREARALHVWAGARPLVKDSRVGAGDTRHMSRGMSILDHAERDGISGILTISGGKLTTYRLMAEHLVDAMEAQLGEQRECRTAQEAVPGADGHTYEVTHNLASREADRLDDQIICECELMSRGEFVRLLRQEPSASLDDLRRQLRLGMGPCQGGFCSLRAAGIACTESDAHEAGEATELLRLFLDNRWGGIYPILHGDQVRQVALDAWITEGILDLAHAPTGPAGERRRHDIYTGEDA